jgi:X-X-X-Leu-X-X-Gly heptad repeat protein
MICGYRQQSKIGVHMKHQRQWSTVAAAVVFVATFAPNVWSSDKKAVLEEVNRKYYSLKTNGFTEFSCRVAPDFETFYKSMNLDAAARDRVLATAKKVSFQVVVGPTGAASISHQFSEAPPSNEVAAGLSQIADGVEQMVSGFFQTWSQLMINSPLPGASNEYQMEDLRDGYRFTAEDGKTHVAISMNHDLVIDSIEAKTPQFEGTVRPKFVDSNNGLVLDSYQAVYKTASSDAQELSVKITYREIEGLSLPKTITLTMALPQGKLEAPIDFLSCQVKKK